jgi:hypothetical protein
MKKIIIISVIVITVIGLILGVIYKIQNQQPQAQTEEEVIPTPTIVLPTVSENIKVDLTAGSGKQNVILKVSGLTDDIQSIEYEITYQTGAGLARGVLGKITLNGEKEITRNDIVLGTCSSGKCVYDTGVNEVNLSLKFNTKNSSSIFQKTYTL